MYDIDSLYRYPWPEGRPTEWICQQTANAEGARGVAMRKENKTEEELEEKLYEMMPHHGDGMP